MAAGAATGAAGGAASMGGGGGAPPSVGGGGGGGLTVQVMPGAIVIQGGSGDAATTLTENALALIFERVALTQGLGQ